MFDLPTRKVRVAQLSQTCLAEAVEPRTHNICDIKNFWTKFCPNLTILVSLESWRRDLFKFGKTKLNRNHKFAKIENLGLGLRIKNLDLS